MEQEQEQQHVSQLYRTIQNRLNQGCTTHTERKGHIPCLQRWNGNANDSRNGSPLTELWGTLDGWWQILQNGTLYEELPNLSS